MGMDIREHIKEIGEILREKERTQHSMIPSCIVLDPRAAAKFSRWVEYLQKSIIPTLPQSVLDELDGGATPESPIVFTIYNTGLGPSISATAHLGINHIMTGLTISLSINDDNELIPDEWVIKREV